MATGWTPRLINRLTKFRPYTSHATCNIVIPVLRCLLAHRLKSKDADVDEPDDSHVLRKTEEVIKQSKVLEIGAGMGALHSLCGAATGCEWVQTEPSQLLIDSKITSEPIIQCSAQDLTKHFRGNSTDAVVACNVLDYLNMQELDDALKAIRSILTPTGYIVHFQDSFWSGLSLVPTLTADLKDEFIPFPYYDEVGLQVGVQLVSKQVMSYDILSNTGFPQHMYDDYVSDPVRNFQKMALESSERFQVFAGTISEATAALDNDLRKVVTFLPYFVENTVQALFKAKFRVISASKFTAMALVDSRVMPHLKPSEPDKWVSLTEHEIATFQNQEEQRLQAKEALGVVGQQNMGREEVSVFPPALVDVFDTTNGFFRQNTMDLNALEEQQIIPRVLGQHAKCLPVPPFVQRSSIVVTIATKGTIKQELADELQQLMNAPLIPFIEYEPELADKLPQAIKDMMAH